MSDVMGKLERKHYLTFLDSTFGGSGSPSWFWLGDDMEELTTELNPDTEIVKNIKGVNSVKDNGYEPSMSGDPYYANPSDGAFYEHIKDIAFNRLKGDACKTKILEVIMDKTSGTYDGWTEDVIIKPTSIGGGTDGVNIPFDVTYCGNRQKVSVSINDGVPTVTP